MKTLNKENMPTSPPNTIRYAGRVATVIGKVFQQIHINKGLKRFGAHAEQAGIKEMRQIHDHQVLNLFHWDQLTPQERE